MKDPVRKFRRRVDRALIPCSFGTYGLDISSRQSVSRAGRGGFSIRRTVRGVGWRHRLSEADVDEVMQQVRIRLWRAQGDSEQIARAPASYVYRTAVSAALDLIRRRQAQRFEQTTSMEESEEIGSG